jgi:uncharacterized protein
MQPFFAGSSQPSLSSGRVDFIRSAYVYLAGAILAFVALSGALHVTGINRAMLKLLGGAGWAWMGVMAAFMLVGWLATRLANNGQSNQTQLMGLGIYVIAEALIFAPMLALASLQAPGAIGAAGFVTVVLVGGLTWTAFTTKSNFSFLGNFLKIGGLVALGTIVVSLIFGFQLGIWFSGLMVLFAGASVLYDTAKIIHDYPADRPAGAALHLFASIALLFWYVLRILMSLSGSRD